MGTDLSMVALSVIFSLLWLWQLGAYLRYHGRVIRSALDAALAAWVRRLHAAAALQSGACAHSPTA
jgi:hypothetical protein